MDSPNGRSGSPLIGNKGEVMKPERNAGLIMGTNNSSIVSKRSVERLYHPEPHFLRHFVRKPQRRSPTINRGYWLRMRAVEHVVREFLERPSEQRKMVVNLGCGYDPLPFQWLAREPELCRNVRFVDVDYKALMLSKKEIIESTPQMNDLLSSQTPPKDDYVVLNASQYVALGCDLRDIRGLDSSIRSLTKDGEHLILCVAEVSVIYMSTDAADALIEWASHLSSDVTFCLLQQYLPDGADHPFAETMLKHFEKLNTPLRSIHDYPDLHSHTQRFFALGYEKVNARNLWWLWSDPLFLSPSQRLALDKIEPFDEWEEFALFASHYILLVAQVGVGVSTRARRMSNGSSGSDVSARTASPRREENQLFGLTYVENIPAERGRAHHGSAFAIEGGVAIAYHGGVGPQARLGSTDVYGPPAFKVPTAKLPTASISPRCCHTITTLHNGDIILVGGRASPAAAMQDCWIQKGIDWERIQDLPSPRYRHSAAPVILPGNILGLVVWGGKEDQSKVHVDTLLWDLQNGWRSLNSLGSDTIPTFGANMLSLGPSHGFLFGGMRQDGIIGHSFWRWRLGIVDEKVTGIAFSNAASSLDVSIGIRPFMGRFGAAASIIGGSILVIGGIASASVIPRKYETLSMTGDFLTSKSSVHDAGLSVTAVEPDRQEHWPRPVLVGHSSVTTIRGNVLIVGGGAVCFSFGMAWNKGTWLIHDGTTRPATAWALLDPDGPPSSPAPVVVSNPQAGRTGALRPINHLTISTAEDFRDVVRQAVPRVLESVETGPCRNLWTLDYLKEKVGTDRQVVVHHAPSQSMNFVAKNFKYVKQSFGDFLDLAAKGAHLYLRSISSENPTQKPAVLAEDFPQIADDFRVPPEIQEGIKSFHSSALRISSDISMWLHYDVMANLYCQIRGRRRLVIYPPSDITRLDFPPGSTTSRLGLFDSNSSTSQFDGVPGTDPVEAVLKPGDVLFIPPLWPHTGAPEGGVSIAVNIFFRNLPAKEYVAGRDIYGNRDLQAYGDGRRDIEKIVRRFDHDMPAEVAQAYLHRLADELKAIAARFKKVDSRW